MSIGMKSVFVLLAVTLLYTLAGYFLAPAWIERELAAAVSERTGRGIEIQRVAVNPFNLTVKLSNLSIEDPASALLVSVSQVTAKVRIASLWTPGWSFRKLVVDAPRLSIPAGDDSGNGFTLPSLALSATTSAADSLPVRKIAHLRITRGEIRLPAPGPNSESARAALEITAIDLSVENLSTLPGQRGEFELAATINQIARIAAEGEFVPFSAVLDATVEVSDLNIAEISPTLRLGTELELESALMAGKVAVRFDDARMAIFGDIGLRQIVMVDRSTRAVVFTAAEALATQVAIGPSPVRARVEDLRLIAPHFRITRNSDGTLQGLDWLRPFVDGTTGTQGIVIEDGYLDFGDFLVSPPGQFDADHIQGSINQTDTGAEASRTLFLEGRNPAGAVAEIRASWRTGDPVFSSNVNLTLGNLNATLLSPYLSALAGREITSGKLDLEIEYRLQDGRANLVNEISATAFELGAPVGSTDKISLPLDLAVALLEDSNDQIRLTIPVPPGRLERTSPARAFGDAFDEFVTEITDDPFMVLGELVGWSEPGLGHVAFESGSAALTASTVDQLAILGTALEQRPGLGLIVTGRYDRVTDRDALARQQMRLHVALASSAGPPGMAAVTPLNLSDPKVISILDEFASTRLRPDTLAAIQARFPERGEPFYDSVFESLVANEAVSATALRALARYRAQSIVNQLVAAGIDSGRLRIGTEPGAVEAQDAANLVELEVTLYERGDIHESPGVIGKTHGVASQPAEN